MSPESTDESTNLSHGQTLSWTGDFRWATLDRPVGAVVALLSVVPFWSFGGLAGVLAWLGIVGTWLLFPPVVPVVFGQFTLVALTPAEATFISILPAEGALLALLAASFLDSRAWLPTGPTEVVSTRQNVADAFGYLGATIALCALIVYVVEALGPLIAGGLCLGILGVIAIVLRPALPDEATQSTGGKDQT